jgi:hypothetical protein
MGWLPWKGKKKKLEQPDEAARKDAAPPPTNSAGNPKSGAAGGSGARYCPPAARLCLRTFFVPTLRLVCCGRSHTAPRRHDSIALQQFCIWAVRVRPR